MAGIRYTSRSLRRRRNTDQWEAVLSHKDPLTGEIIRTFHTVEGKTKRQAEKARDELILELERKGGAVGSNITVRDFMEAYLAQRSKDGTLEPSTVRSYKSDNNYILRYLGNERLSELTVPDIAKWMSDMTADGYKPKSCAKAFRLFKMALKWAQAQDLLTKNPCDYCKPPKRDKTPINALSREDRTRMLALARQAQPKPLGLAVELALTTGMRRGEVCALRWSDLNDDGTITVSHALGNGNGGFYVKSPKTSSSARTIPLTNHLYLVLSAMKRDSERIAFEFGLPKVNPFILGTQEPDSKPYNPTQLGKDFSAFCEMSGFDCTFHDLRHTFATMMIAEGCDVRTVASYLGHSSVSMTLNVYADVDPDAKKAAVTKVEDSFDLEFYDTKPEDLWGSQNSKPKEAPGISFTVEQLEAMLAEAKKREEGAACAS